MKYIDLRSDTVTRPSTEMKQAMVDAELGDDVLGDDPTVIELEKFTAKLFNKEAALFVPSGTMGNQICLRAHSEPGWEILCERECHIVNYEVAGPAVHSQLLVNLLNSEHGMIEPDTIRESIRHFNMLHSPMTKMVSLENTHNRHSGAVLPQDKILEVKNICDEHNLIYHLDGARIWNAHIKTGMPLDELVAPFDSVSVCLSKGLGAPVGSLALGTKEFITTCLRERKLFGGGMRQSGMLAAAGLYAIKNNLSKLKDDHDNCMYLSTELNKLSTFEVDTEWVHTNIVIFKIVGGETAQSVFDKLTKMNIGAIPTAQYKVRFVTHLDVSKNDIDEAVERIKKEFN
ncbi:MAG: low specificity L-threonine aldolase [Calditrichaeota bacterium]|nr:MAG: low specificity L-threonine aldolase [Calditrichota bacterium]